MRGVPPKPWHFLLALRPRNPLRNRTMADSAQCPPGKGGFTGENGRSLASRLISRRRSGQSFAPAGVVVVGFDTEGRGVCRRQRDRCGIGSLRLIGDQMALTSRIRDLHPCTDARSIAMVRRGVVLHDGPVQSFATRRPRQSPRDGGRCSKSTGRGLETGRLS